MFYLIKELIMDKNGSREIVININADRLISSASLNYRIGKTTEPPTYLLDLNARNASFCYAEDPRPDNALFYQVRDCAQIHGINARKDEALLYRCIIFVDFSDYFNYIPNKNVPIILEEITNGPKDPYSQAGHLSRIFSSKFGITIKYKDGEEVQFIAFDKSASMARHSKISFIRKELYEDVNKRLTIGIPFDQLKMQLSKYFAYRGLYLSTSERIPEDTTDEEKPKFVLNEETVIVLDDFEHDLQDNDDAETRTRKRENKEGQKEEIKQINTFPKQYTVSKTEQTELGDSLHIFEEKYETFTSNAFDGEGLISPAYAAYINNIIHPENDDNLLTNGTYKKANSFQIRYCFMKGMLHNVNFHQFLNEFIKDDDPVINDIYNIPRHLKNAQIILTKSMFKCATWYKEAWDKGLIEEKEREDDPMKVFFERCRNNKHSLYISDDDTTLNKTGHERLNYQFLSTFRLSPEHFDKLIEQHFNLSQKAIKATFVPENENKTNDPIIKAAAINPKFYCEPQIISKVMQYLKNARIDCGMGSLRTRGYNKFLSADLLQFLLHYTEEFEPKNSDEYKKVKDSCLISNSYMPKTPLSTPRFALLRNPHLSENENCISSPNTKQTNVNGDKTQQDIYERYFGNLSGVIMIPEQNLVPMALGGADFDGDHAKIYFDNYICDSIYRNCYNTDEKLQNEGLIRTKPIVSIPQEKSDETYITEPTDEIVNTKLLVNTFSNQTGVISNLALAFALEEYRFTKSKHKIEDDYCAKATAITGLEIDSAKKGKHPVADIEDLRNKVTALNKEKDGQKFCLGKYFTDCKNALKGLKGASYKVETENGANTYRLVRYSKKDKNIIIGLPDDKDAHGLLRLPYEFAHRESIADDRKTAKEILPTPPKDSVFFNFELDKEWYRNLNNNLMGQVHELVYAYSTVKNDIRNYEIEMKQIRFSKSYNKLSTLLKIKYDCEDAGLPKNIVKLQDQTIEFVKQYLSTEIEAEIAMQNIQELQWHITPKEQRLDTLFKILNIPKGEEIDKELLNFITDFAGEGYYILYYAIKYVLQQYIENITPEQHLGEKRIAEIEKNNRYYRQLLSLYSNIPNNTNPLAISIDETDEDSDDSDTHSNDEDLIIQITDPWSKRLNSQCIILFKEIFKDAKHNDEDIIKYAWVERGFIKPSVLKKTFSAIDDASDPKGYFFWNIVPEVLKETTVHEFIYRESEA